MTIQSDIATLIVDNNQGLITPHKLRQALQLLIDAHSPSVLLAAIEPGLRKLYIGYAQPWQPGHAYTANELVRKDDQLFVVLGDYTSATGPAGVNIASGLSNAMMADIQAGNMIRLGGGGGTGGGGGVNPPADLGRTQDYAFNPRTQTVGWRDARLQMAVVTNKTDLNSRTLLPTGDLQTGKLVYVMSEQKLYELIKNPASLANTLADWRALGGGGVTYVGRVTGLPDPKSTNRPKNGALYVIKNDFEGKPLYRLVSWDDTIVGAYQTYNVRPLGFQATDRITDSTALTALFTAGPVNEGRWYVIEDPAGLVPQPGEPFAGTQLPLGTKLVDLGNASRGTSGWAAVSPDGNYGAGGLPIQPAVQVIDDRSLPRVTGGWRYLSMQNYINTLASDYDHPFDNIKGDFQTTIENNHAVLKVFDGRGWQTLFSEDEIKGWIASLALFRGTASEDPTQHPGTVDLISLPDLPTLSTAADKTHTGRYWIWAGQDPFNVVRSAAAGTAAAVTPAAGQKALAYRLANGVIDQARLLQITQTAPKPAQWTAFAVDQNVTPDATSPIFVGDTLRAGEFIVWTGFPTVTVDDPANNIKVDGGWAYVTGISPGDRLTISPRLANAFIAAPAPVTGTPRIGVDLDGSILHVGDWLVIADRGNGIPGDAHEVDLHWVRVGGDLLTKSRGISLFGLNSWQPGGYEQGSLVTRSGDIYRARTPVVAGDPAPDAVSVFTIPAAGTGVTVQTSATSVISTNADLMNLLVVQPAPPQWTAYPIRAAFTPAGTNTGFDGTALAVSGAMIWTGMPNLTYQDTANDIDVHNGWMYMATPPTRFSPTAAYITAMQQAAQAFKWDKVPIGGAIKFIVDENALPGQGSIGDSYLILTSLTYGGGNPAIVTWDAGTSQWVSVSGGGGGGVALNLTGGEQIVNVGVPIGSIVAWPNGDLPNGWLICDGAHFDRTVYPVLFAILGQENTPDLQGQFIRGGTPQANFAHHQWTTGRPRHALITSSDGMHLHSGGFSQDHNNWDSGGGGGPHLGWIVNTGRAGEHHHTVTGGGDPETAPDHVVLQYIIKADDRGLNSRA